MKRILISAAAALFASTAAYAADPFVYEPAAPAPIIDAPGFSWTGFYVGVNGGYGGGKAKVDGHIDYQNAQIASTQDLNGFALVMDPESELGEILGRILNSRNNYLGAGLSNTGSGFVAVVQAGYNWQSGSMVYGIETDIQWSGIKAELSGYVTDGTDTVSADLGSKITWYGTTRLRIGYTPVERFMVYGTGGVAYGRTEVYANLFGNNTPLWSGSMSKTKVGWTVGAGAEYAFTDKLSLKGEYLYTDLGKWNLVDWTQNGVHVHADTSFRFHTVRLGLNFHF